MPSAHLTLREEDVIRLSLEFLHNRSLHITQLSLERESGIINGCHSDDALFLRQLILDGQWDDVLEFVQPLEAIDAFDSKKFHYIILKYKYFELLCIKAEAPVDPNNAAAVDELVKALNELEKYTPSKEAYSQLCLYLTLPRLHEHADFKDWNPSGARVLCWSQVFPLVEKFLPAERRGGLAGQGEGVGMARNDRLIQLIIKGLLYESCVDYCQNQATGDGGAGADLKFSSLLAATSFSDSDLSLLSWLQSIPPETFACPFEQKTLNVDVERIEKPSLEASWTEHLLVTPIKPRTFPHSAMPYSRPKATDIMSRSLNPNLDGLPFGLGANRNSMALSTGDITMMSKSIASFHLTGKKTMNTSVDRLFDTENVFTSSSYGDLPTIIEKDSGPKAPPRRARSRSPDKRQSTDSLNKPALHDKSEKEIQEEKAASPPPPALPPRSSPTPPLPPPLHAPPSHHHPPPQAQQPIPSSAHPYPQHPKHNVPLPPVPDGKPPLPPSQSGHPPPQPGSHAPHPPHNNNYNANGRETTSELYSIYQRRQQMMGQQQQHMYDHYSNNNNAMTVNMGSTQASNMNMNRMMGGMGPPMGAANNDTYLPKTQHQQQQQQQQQQQHQQQQHQHQQPTHQGPAFLQDSEGKPRFLAVTTLEDVQAVRCAEFHPSGHLYAVGSNSKTLRICAYPKLNDLRDDHTTYQPTVLFKRTKHHKGSIYCLAWSPMGDLVATGSNDKTVKLMRFNADACNMEGQEIELSMHDGTVRDMCFIEDTSNKSSLLISGGAGDCKIYVTDCATGTPFQALSGHTGHILALHTWGGAMFVSGSQDRTVRFWDLRTRGCVNVITPAATPTKPGTPVASVCVDPSGRLLVCGHEDSLCTLYDIRGARTIQAFRPHSSDVRSLRFSPSAYYLLTSGYDNKLVLTDLQGDLTMPLPSVVVAEHSDKVISGRWHPTDFSFVSTSADKTCTLWALPPV